jgi:hypothetical protein
VGLRISLSPHGQVTVEKIRGQRPKLEVHHRVVGATQLGAAADESALTLHCGLEHVVGTIFLRVRKNVTLEQEIWDEERVQHVCRLDPVFHDPIGRHYQQRDGA